MWRCGQEELTEPYVERYFAELPGTAEVRSGWVLADPAECFFPATSLHRRPWPGPDALIARSDLDLSMRRRLVDRPTSSSAGWPIRAGLPAFQ